MSLLKVYLKIDSDKGSINTLGDVLYNTGSIISRLKMMQLSFLYPEYFDSADIKSDFDIFINNLKQCNKNLSHHKASYTECKPIEELYGESLVVNELNGKFEKVNIIDYLFDMIKQAEEFEKLEGVVKNSSLFLEENFFGTVKHDIMNVLNKLTVCIEDNTVFIDNTTAVVTVIMALVLFLYALVVAILLRTLNKSFLVFSEVFYEKFKKKNKNIVNLCNNILEKDKNFNVETFEYPSELSNSTKTHHSKSFLCLILPIVAFICIYIGIVNVYSSDLSKKIKYNPILKVNLIQRKALYDEIFYYSTKSYIANLKISELITQENFSTAWNDYESIIKNCTLTQKKLLKTAQKPEYQIFTSSYNKKCQFYSLEDPDAFFTIGSLAAGRNIVYDMLALANTELISKDSEGESSLELLLKIYERNDVLPKILNSIIIDLDNYSNSKLDAMYNELVIISAVFTLLLFTIVLIIGKIFIRRKCENFKNLVLICAIMMNN